MNIVRNITWGAIAAAALVAGCTTAGPGGGSSATQAAARHPVEGEWMSTDGVAVSRFTGGIFTTSATDTGNKLAEGSYRVGDDRTISIQGTSLIRQTPIAFNCLLATPTQLNCTNAQGQNFSLNRRQAAPV